MDDIHKLTLLQARVSETNKENQHVMQPGNPSNDTSNKKQKQCFDKIEDKEGSQGARYECCGRELVVGSKCLVCESADEDEYGDEDDDLVSDDHYSSTGKYDNETVWKAMAEMIIIDGLPFSFVEGIGFKEFCAVSLPPEFEHPSRRTMAKYAMEIYVDMRAKLNNLLKNEKPRVSLTIEKWTSLQSISYMCLAAHWIDGNWKLQKRILNFLPIESNTDTALGDVIVKCLLGWGIDKVFSVTVDNAIANDNATKGLRAALENSGINIMNREHLYMRCVGHDVNMIVSEDLEEISSSVAAVRAAVRYVLVCPVRLRKLKQCAEIDNIESKKALCLDVPDRWNTTFMMLDAAEKYERAYISYEGQDPNFTEDLLYDEDRVPNASDWETVRKTVEILKPFYEMVVETYGNSHVTSNKFFLQISTVDSVFQELKNSEDIQLSSLALRMKSKWEKYWGDSKEINKTIFISAVLDPTQKLTFVEFVFARFYGETRGRELTEMVKEATYELFSEYKRVNSLQVSKKKIGKSVSFADEHGRKEDKVKLAFKKFISDNAALKIELDKYLAEDIMQDDKFDILNWWKDNQSKFPVLSEMARDVLAVPISTLTSESAFTMGDRVLDEFRSSLPPGILQALICAQSWLTYRSSCTRSPSIEEFFSNTSIDDDFDNTSTEDDFGDDPDEMEDELPEPIRQKTDVFLQF